MVLILAAAALAAAWLEPAEPARSGTGRATDGDSLVLAGARIRLLGLDAPELAQSCTGNTGGPWACGEEARAEMARLLRRGTLRCEPKGRDRYQRLLARCSVGDLDLAAAMVSAGLAVADGGYFAEQAAARAARRGIWSGSFQDPKDWRGQAAGEDDAISWVFRWFGS